MSSATKSSSKPRGDSKSPIIVDLITERYRSSKLSHKDQNDLRLALPTLEYYEVDATAIGKQGRKLLTEYSSISISKINEHVNAVRKMAFEIFPYPCVGMYRFLGLGLINSCVYDEVIERCKAGAKFLDLGCCFGQEIRQLLMDGVPATNTYGLDLRREFVDLGFELFQDKEKEGGKITFIFASIFEDNSKLDELNAQMSIVYTGLFFHLFSWEKQFNVAKRILALLKSEPGVMIIGQQVGNLLSGNHSATGYAGEETWYRHDENSWIQFWNAVGDATNTKWEVDAVLDPQGVGFSGSEINLTKARGEDGARRLRFVVRRV